MDENGEPGPVDEMQYDQTEDTIAEIKEAGDCAVVPSLDTPMVDGFYDTIAIREDDVATMDINPAICPSAQLCAPVREGRVVWRDRIHLGPGFVRMIREDLWAELEDTGFVADVD